MRWPGRLARPGRALPPTTQQPSHAVIFKLMKAIDDEQSLETFEDIMGEDPLLAYRFMVYPTRPRSACAPASIRCRGLVMMGYSSIKRWLSDQLPHAEHRPNMQPVREAMVMRAQLTQHGCWMQASGRTTCAADLPVWLCSPSSTSCWANPRHHPQSACPCRTHLRRHAAAQARMSGGLQMACRWRPTTPAPFASCAETFEMDLKKSIRALLRVLSGSGSGRSPAERVRLCCPGSCSSRPDPMAVWPGFNK